MRPIPWHSIIAEVIFHIDPCDTTTLLACSLTHPSWTLVAQRWLYRILKIRNGEAMHRWRAVNAKDRFTSYVRHLTYCGDKVNPLRPRDFLDVSGSQLSGFNKLDTLEMRYLELNRFDSNSFRRAFGHFGDTLTALHISNVTMTSSKFLHLLSLFPRLQYLGLSCFTMGREFPRATGKRPAFRGTLSLSGPINKHGLRFIVGFIQGLPGFSSVRLRLNLSYRTTRRLLEVSDVANNVTTMLLGYQDDIPECIDLSRCHNLRMLSIRPQGHDTIISTGPDSQTFFQLLRTITSRKLEFIIVEAYNELSSMRYSVWGQFFKEFAVLQASCKRLSIFVGSYEKFMKDNFRKGPILTRFLGV